MNKTTTTTNNTNHKIIGALGYTILNKNQIKVMIISDMHDVNEKCGDTYISDWLKKQQNIKLLLEEIPIYQNFDSNFKELFPSAPHTKKLRELYEKNYDKIVGIDIRGELIPFSWELLDGINPNEQLTLQEYLENLNRFFQLSHPFFIDKIYKIYKHSIINDPKSNIGIHFNICKTKFEKYKRENEEQMEILLQDIFNSDKQLLQEINQILCDCMELYTIMELYNQGLNGTRRFIIHAGLFHTSNIIKLFAEIYKFKIIDNNGLTNFDNIDKISHNGCNNISIDF
jgi:hypothetical protein